jgi:pilus assembly protein Flp/PilA
MSMTQGVASFFSWPPALLRSVRQRRTDRGASAVEYGLLIAGVAAMIVLVVFAFGDNVTDSFSQTCETFANPRTDTCVSD